MNTLLKYSFLLLLVAVSFSINAQDTLSIGVSGLCEMCSDRIETTATETIGVTSAKYSLEKQLLFITYQTGLFDVNELHRAIAAEGHDTELLKADDKVYNDLPLCCLYRAEEETALETKSNYEILVGGRCGMCKMRIEAAALNTIGVKKATYDLETNLLSVSTEGAFLLNELHKNMAMVGHDTELEKAALETYEGLPACCDYRPESDNQVLGYVYTLDAKGETELLIGANVYWSDLSDASTTDTDGAFVLPYNDSTPLLVISYVGFGNDTILIEKPGHLEITLDPAIYMEEIEIKGRKRTSEVSYVSPIKVLNVGKRELTKAACCSLSESFQTTPAVDESFTDAVTGTRTIEMLGLASPYIQITRESIPDIRGLSAIHGMEYTPGPWIQGIQLNQGSGSVVNGFESLTGQINVDLFNPYSEEAMYFNAYANEGGRYEANLTANHEVSDHVATAILLHGSTRTIKHDRNNDGFLDMPLSEQFVLVNRWKYDTPSGWEGQTGVKLTKSKSESGQKSFFQDDNQSAWNSALNTNRYEFWSKAGRLFNENRSTVGFQLSGVYHDMESHFGNRNYDGIQKSLYVNLIFQTLIGESGSNIKLGGTVIRDDFDENVAGTNYLRKETVPGVFTEYTYLIEEKFSFVGGMRYDVHNIYGGFLTPRAHVRFAPKETTVFRVSAGRGQKTASVFAENIGGFASSRDIIIESQDNDNPYGLDPEVAWNFGFNVQHEFYINERLASVGVDYYRTEFENQVVVDYESAGALRFYNLDGKSFSNSIQFLGEFELIDRLDFRLAYRLNDVQTDFTSGRKEKPLIAKHRAFANVAYETINGWKFDYTINRIGTKRIPLTNLENQERSPAFFLSNAQVSKLWNNKFEIYLGAENLFNYRQEDPIQSASDPFSNDFDASLVWGPIFGRTIYAGVRYKIFNDSDL